MGTRVVIYHDFDLSDVLRMGNMRVTVQYVFLLLKALRSPRRICSSLRGLVCAARIVSMDKRVKRADREDFVRGAPPFQETEECWQCTVARPENAKEFTAADPIAHSVLISCAQHSCQAHDVRQGKTSWKSEPLPCAK